MGVAIAGAIPGIVAGSTTALVVGTVINIVIAAVLGKILAPDVSDGRDTRALQRTLRNTIMPRRVIYGECLAGGPYVVIETTGKQNEELIFVIVLASHPVEDIIGVIMHDEYMDISGRWPTAGSQGDSDLDSNYYIDNGAFGSTFSSDKRFEMIEIIKSNGWGYADFQHVTAGGGQDPLDDRARAGEMESSMGGTDWTIPTSTVRDSGTGLYDNDTAPVQRAKLTNLAHIFLNFRYEPDIFSGWPAPNFHVKGKRLYNPNLDSSLTSYGAAGGSHDLDDPDTWEWSEDWTLCCLDYLINTSYGLGAKASTSSPEDVTLNEIDWAAMVQSYQESSEVTTNGLPTGHKDFGSAPRYTINGLFELGDTPISIMESLLASGSGELIYSQGVYKIRPGVYRLPNSENDIINEDMMVGPLTIQTHTPRSDLFNKAAGVFVDKGFDESISKGVTNLPLFVSADFELVDPLDSSGTNPFEVIDGEEIIEHFDYPFTIRNYEAQRLARIQLERVRRGFTVSFEATLEVLKYSVGDTVYLEILNNSKYSSEVFYNRLGLDDSVQDRPDSPFTPYYKQFKIITMEYTEDFTIAMTMIEESETIYDWNDGMASPDEDNLVSDLVIEDPLGLVEVPYFVVASPDQTITEIENISGMSILVRWTAPERGSVVNQIDKAHIDNYVLEFGIVDNPSEADPADRVSAWSPGGIFTPTDRTLTTQGPITISNLFIDPDTDYDFRLRSVTFSGRSSLWAYYSTDIGSDFTPTEPNNANRYYIKPTNGTAIKNSVGTLTVEAREVGILGDVLLTSGDIKLYVGSLEVTTGNGYPSPSDGYTGTFGDTEILGNVVVELRNDSLGQLFDTITLADITDGGTGSDSTFGYIEAKDTLAWVKNQDGVWDPSDTSTNMDVTFTRGGSDVARWSYAIDLGGVPEGLQDGGSTTHTGGNLNTGHITPTVTFAPFDRACLMEYHYNDGAGNVSYVAENVTVTYGGLQRYYILPSNTAIRNGVGTITLEARLVDELGDNLITSGNIKLFDENFNVIETASPGNYPSPSDGYTGTLTAAEINGSETVYLGDPNSPTKYYDTVTLVDVTDGEAGVVGWIEPEFLAWRRDINGGAWVPSQTTAQFDIIFNIGGTDVARQGYEITRTGAGTLTGATNTASSPGNLNTSRITLDITGSGTTNLTVKADYSFDALNGSVSETIFTVTGGDDSEFYYILPTNGTAIKDVSDVLLVEAHKATGAVDELITTGTIQIYDPDDNLVDTSNGYPSPSDGYTGSLGRDDITESIVLTLKDGPSGQSLDSITLVDTLDLGTIPNVTTVIEYDDLDTTQGASGSSRYAMLTSFSDTTSGSQNNFHLTDAILLNEEDLAGTNRENFYLNLRPKDRVVYYISPTRWYLFEINQGVLWVVASPGRAYLIGVTLLDYVDSTPGTNIPTTAGTTVEFQFQTPASDPFNLLRDPDFDLSTSITLSGTDGYWNRIVKDTGGPASGSTFSFDIGGGAGGSNSIELHTGTSANTTSQAGVRTSARIRANFGDFLFRIRYKTVATVDQLTCSVFGYDDPTANASSTSGSIIVDLPDTSDVWTDVAVHVSPTFGTTARFWNFAVDIRGTHTPTIGFSDTIDIESIFIESVSEVFGSRVVSNKAVPGVVPEADQTTDAGAYLGADGTWSIPGTTGSFQGLGTWRHRTETATPPSSGQIRFNNGTPTSATSMYIHETNDTSTDMSAFLALLDDGSVIYLQDKSDANNFFIVELSSFTDSGAYVTLGIQSIVLEGVEPSQNQQMILVVSSGGGGGSGTLEGLTDTTITTPADGALLLYDTGTATWRDATMGTDATITDVGALTISADAVSYAKMQNVGTANRLLGSLSAGGIVTELTGTQVNTVLPNFTTSLDGLAPSSGGGTTNYLRADGSWAAPAGSGGTVTSVSAGNGLNFTTITGAGPVTMGTPGSLTTATTNAVTTTSHTHAVTGFAEISGTPANNRIGVWTSATNLEGDPDLTWNGLDLTISSGVDEIVLGINGGAATLNINSVALFDISANQDMTWQFGDVSNDVNVQLTNTSQLLLPASTTGFAPLVIAEGAAPSSPVTGDIWHDNSTDSLMIRTASGTKNLSSGADITAAENVTGQWDFNEHVRLIPSGSQTIMLEVHQNGATADSFIQWRNSTDSADKGLVGWDNSANGFIIRSATGDNVRLEANTALGDSIILSASSTGTVDFIGGGDVQVRDGATLSIFDSTDVDSIQISTTLSVARFQAAAGNDITIGVNTNDGITIKSAGSTWLGYATDDQVFRTQDNNATDNITGAEIKHWDGSYYDVGMARMPKVNMTGALTVSDTHWHKRIVHNGTIDASFNLTFNTESTQPQDVVLWVMAKNGPIVLVDGSMVLHFYDGSGAPATGNITVARGGWATVVKDTDSAAHVTGVGLS